MNCKFCKSDRISIIKQIESPHVNHLYTLFECKNCDSRFFNIKEHDEVDLSKIYEKVTEGGKLSYSEEFRENRYWANQVKIIMRLLGRKPVSVLDVGCRTGDFLMHWDSGIAVEGVELDRNNIQIARKRGLTVYNGFFENIKFNKKYEVVTCYALIEHLVNPVVSLDKLARIVTPDGIMVVMIPTHQSIKRWIIDAFTSMRWHMYSPPEHLNFYSKKFLDSYLSSKGFNLQYRYWTSGGMFNPFKNIPFANCFFGKIMTLIDECTSLNKFAFFDHLYSYYVKNG